MDLFLRKQVGRDRQSQWSEAERMVIQGSRRVYLSKMDSSIHADVQYCFPLLLSLTLIGWQTPELPPQTLRHYVYDETHLKHAALSFCVNH